MRHSDFDKDFFDLHGVEPDAVIEGEILVSRRPPRERGIPAPTGPRWAYRMSPFARIALGSLGLFWGLVLGAFLIGFVAVIGVFVWAFFTT
jgi:hypothetical protein